MSLAIVAAAQPGELPDYVASRQMSGTIRVCGSPQMGDLLNLYERGFVMLQPAVHFDNQLTNTLTAVEGVYTGHADIGLLGREIWPAEAQAFESRAEHGPTLIDIATGSYDVPKATFALMIFVPRSNPIASVSIGQLERIFAASATPIRTWGELGLKGKWATRPIHLYGFPADNDKSKIFSKLVFNKGDSWSAGLQTSTNAAGPGGADAGELIVRAVENDPDAIGVSNIHYATPGVKALPISTSKHTPPVAPSRDTVANRSYPLTRAVYMVLNIDSTNARSSAVIEFLRYVLSRQGQQAVMQEGNYLPLPP